METNKNKIILDLCGGTGAWSEPYRKAGYSVINVTLPDYNVTKWGSYANIRQLICNHRVYGILAAPPCTMFSFARTKAKKPRDLKEGMKCVRTCLNIIWSCMEVQQETAKKTLPLKFWALENPYYGFLKFFIGKPNFVFHPYEFGDGYKKLTALWGNFKLPKKMIEEKSGKYYAITPEGLNKLPDLRAIERCKTNSRTLPKFDKLKTKEIHGEFYGELDRQARRAITPAGFAKEFFKANR